MALLLQVHNDPEETSKITIADINPKSIKTRVEKLDSPKVYGETVDIYDKKALIKLMKEHDIVIQASLGITVYTTVLAALEAGVNIITMLGPRGEGVPVDEFGMPTDEFTAKLNSDFEDAGVIGIMGLGSAPGTSNLMGRYFGDKFDTIESMEFSYVYGQKGEKRSFFPFTPIDMIRQYVTKPLVLRGGKFMNFPPRAGREWAQYPDPIGMVDRFYIRHTEATEFGKFYKDKGIQNAGTKSGWGSEFLAGMEFLDSFGLLDLEPKKFGDVSIAPVDVFLAGVIGETGFKVDEKAKVLDYGCTRLEITGEKDGQRLEYTADAFSSPYKGFVGTVQRTGCPPAIGAHMIRRGEIVQKGCYAPHIGIDPKKYFRELSKRNVELSYTVRYLV
jgi:lysine 6-dehydrogenase